MSVQVPSPEASRRMSGQFDNAWGTSQSDGSLCKVNPTNMDGNEEEDINSGGNISEEKYHFYPYGRGSCDWTLEEHDRIRKKSMDEIESHFNPPSSSVTPTTKETVPEASIERKMDAVASSNPTAKKPGTIGSKFSTAHNTYFLDEDLDMGADIDNLDNVPGSGIQETTEKEESAYHYYDPLSGNTRLATSGGTDNGETWQWGKVDNVLKHSLKERTHPGSYKSSNYDGDARLTAARFEDSGDFDRNMFKSEEAPKEWMAAADDGDIFAHQSKEVKAGAK